MHNGYTDAFSAIFKALNTDGALGPSPALPIPARPLGPLSTMPMAQDSWHLRGTSSPVPLRTMGTCTGTVPLSPSDWAPALPLSLSAPQDYGYLHCHSPSQPLRTMAPCAGSVPLSPSGLWPPVLALLSRPWPAAATALRSHEPTEALLSALPSPRPWPAGGTPALSPMDGACHHLRLEPQCLWWVQ